MTAKPNRPDHRGQSGIGRAAALLLAQAAGAKVVLAARSGAALHELVGEITQQGGAALAVPADISREDDVTRLFAKGERAFGSVDILVNNASVIQPFGKVWETDPAEWRRLLEINLFGSYLCTRAAVPGNAAPAEWADHLHLLRCGGEEPHRHQRLQ
ncbi:MAG: SDR family oxidoreductase [Calditrichae bacterium]|nr:SDR family oxidoreductase [Calditrichia bacterium]